MSGSLAILDKLYREPGPRLVDRLNEGLPLTVFAALATALNLPTVQLAKAIGLSDRTLRTRAKSKRLTPDEAERSFRVFRVFRRAVDVLGTDDHARAWLNTPQRALGERKPVDMLVRDVGADEVLNLLGAIEDGGYV